MPKNYQSNEYKKNANSGDSFKKGRTMTIDKMIEGEDLEKLKDWVTFYRNNIHRFVEHYMGVKLFPYQRVWIYLISQSMIFLGLAARASAKSWLIAVYAIAKCILYPGLTVSLNSSTKGQAGLIISEKVQELYREHPNIQREISNITTNANRWRVDFHNGSKINVVISGEGGRGHRSNVAVLEERRLIPSEIINSIIRPFLVARQAPYMKNPKYANVPIEEPQEVVISSVHYKSGEWFPETIKRLKRLANGDKKIKAFFLDYLIAMHHGIKSRNQMINEKNDMDDITFSQEYGNIPFGGSSNSFFKMDFFIRSLKRPWLPRRRGADGIGKNIYDIERKMGEIRLISVDVASRGGSKNDNTVISLARLFPTKKGWRTEIVYIESYNGENVLVQALRIKQLFDEFCSFDSEDVVILDILNVGIGIYDALTSVTHDEERDVDYDAMQIIEADDEKPISKDTQEDLERRCLTKDAHRCIFPISASASLNSEIASSFRTRLKSGLVHFLVSENEQEEFLISKKNKDIAQHNDIALKAYLLSPNAQTTLLINESVSLDMSLTSGSLIKLVEAAGSRKDRYSSVSYLNYYVSLLDVSLLKEEEDEDELDSWINAAGVV